jgi:CheY-like chemotaxis protein
MDALRGGLGMKRVVAIDDDPLMLELFRELLSDEGYETVLCPSGADARHYVRVAAPAAIIIDLNTHRPNAGWAVLAALRAEAAVRDTPVIVCSADERDAQQHAADLGSHGGAILMKPFDVDTLLQLLTAMTAGATAPPSVG